MWRDSVLYLGKSFDPSLHHHNAVQCCIAVSGKLKIRWDGVEHWQTCTAAIIGANVNHSVSCQDGLVCLVYLEKSSDNYQTILDHHCLESSCQIKKEPLLLSDAVPEELLESLSSCLSNNVDSVMASILKQKCLRFFNCYMSKVSVLDLRISHLLNLLHDRPERSFSGRDLAQTINLSESRMQHLFKQQLGIPIRRYLLWMRIRLVLEQAIAGVSLTEAAHQSGFADSAHFSRTFKAMFGIAASSFLSAKGGLEAVFCY